MKSSKTVFSPHTFTLADIPSKSTVIIGLSGGPDSVYLLHQLVALREEERFTLIAAHLDHEWRSSSNADATFCKDLCKQLAVTLVNAKASELNHNYEYQGSQEELGRNIRRFFFKQLMTEHKANYVALAHHKDDRIETFFINLIRGTTITGLCGMKSIDLQNGHSVIRPLMNVDKAEILNYLNTHKLSYCIDPTNESDTYLRNRIRSHVLPALYACDSRSKEQTLRTITSLQETELFLQTITTESLQQVSIASTEGSKLDLKLFFDLEPFLQKRVIKAWLSTHIAGHRSSQAFFDEILRFLASPRGGTHELSPSWKLVKKQNSFWIEQ